MKNLIVVFSWIIINSMYAQEPSTGIFGFSSDIGNPKNKGSSVFSKTDQSYTVRGSGYNIWFERDEFHYLFNKIKGDFILTANFRFEGKGLEPHRKTGWMIRCTADEDSPHISAVLHGDGLTLMQWRDNKDAQMKDPENQVFARGEDYEVLQLERAGKYIFMRAAHPGEPLEDIGSYEMINMPDEILAGLFVCSHNPNVIEEATIWNVRIDRPVSSYYNPGREGYPGSRLEIMNVFDGKRMVIYEKPDRFEAPNWMPDGTKLLFNMDGLLYKIALAGGAPEVLNTGFDV